MTRETFSLRAFIPYRFAVIADKMSKALAATYAEQYDITIPEWRVLACLLEGEVTAKHVTEITPMDKVKVSRAVVSLEEKKLITRTSDPSDGRAALLKLTEQGRETAAAIKQEAITFQKELFADWTQQEVNQLKDLLNKF